MGNGNGMKFTEVMPGAIIAHASPDVMAGCPSEIVKVLKLKNISLPTTIIMPTLFYAKGLLQAACEFPLYAFLFVLGLFFKGKKLTIVGEADQCERMRNILRLTLLGPTREEMEEWGIEEKEISQILRLNQHFALKKPGTQEVAQIDDMVDFIAFQNDQVEISGNAKTITITKKGTNLFTVNDGEAEVAVDINVHKLQSPPIPIEPKGLVPRAIFGAVALTKCTTGFDHTGYTTALGAILNYMMVLVDGAPWGKEHLRSLGINHHSQVCGHVVSHIHDDHSNIYDLIVNGQKFVLLSDKLGYHLLVKKTALTLGLTEEQVAGLIDLVEVVKGVPLIFYGAEFLFWRTAHPNATLGFSVTMNGKTMVFSGDTVWGKDLDVLVEQGVVDADVAEWIQKAPRLASDVTFMDCGGGAIHPKIAEVATLSPQELSRIVPTHIMSVPEEFSGKFKVIEPGQQWIIIPGRTCETGDMLQVVDAPIFEGLSPAWRNTIFAHGETRSYRPGETVLKLGQSNDRLYVVIGGSVSVKNESGAVLARLAAGDFFGEISIMRGVPVTATVETDAETKLFSLPGRIFLAMAMSTGLFERLDKVHAVRPVMMKFGFTRDLPSRVMNELIQAAEVHFFEPGETVIAQGDTNVDRLYGILHGQASVHFRGRSEVISLYQHDVFGEMAFINRAPRIATVKAVNRLQVFSLSRDDFDRIVEKTPMLYVYLGLLTKERKPATPA